MITHDIKSNFNGDATQTETIYTLATIVSVVLTLLLLLLSPFIAAKLNLSSTLGFIFIAGTLLVSAPRTFARFQLQADNEFTKELMTQFSN